MSKQLLATVLVLALTLPYTARAQDPDPGWRVESARSVGDIIDGVTVPPRVYLAPDGRHIAYEDRTDEAIGVCVVNVADLTPRCVYMPRETGYRFSYNDMFPALRWSPDSQQIALVGMPFQFLRDTDLGLIDLSTPDPTFIQVIDDGFKYNLLDMPAGTSVEVSPVFSPDGSQIAMEQSVAILDTTVTSISLIDLATGDIQPLTRLPGHEDYTRDWGSVISLDWSPDGSALAFSLRHPRFENAYDGLWLVDIASGELTPLVMRETLLPLYRTIFPDIPEENISMIAPVSWSPDGARLLFWAGDPFQYGGQLWAFWLELESGEIHPVPLPTTEVDRANLRGIWPMQAGWSPDGSTLLVSARLIISPDDLHMLVDSDEAPFTALYLLDVTTEQLTLLGHLPQSMGHPFHAYWGPENDVFAGGFYLKLTRD